MGKVVYKGHEINVNVNGFGGLEVTYDGKSVISNSLYSGTTCGFSVREDGEEVKYEVETKGRWQGYNKYIIIKRNGITIFNGK
jgi:hypothetical protein